MSLVSSVPSKAQIQEHLRTQIIDKWIPRAVDPKGGFHQNYDENWDELPDDSRGVVYQSRVLWLASIGGRNDIAAHGAKFLMDRLWDKDKGGFWWSVGLDGKPSSEKHTYGNAFALYALARHANATKQLSDQENAVKVFVWFDKHARDQKLGGWYETLDSDGVAVLVGAGNDSIGTPYGVRSMNTTIHILEALVELYELTSSKLVRQRLLEAFKIVRDRYCSDNGELHYYLTPDYREPRSSLDSYGHELETAYLLLEAVEALGIPKDDKTWRRAKLLMDHCLQVAWDSHNGGFFYEGEVGGAPTEKKKEWWTSAEGLNALRIFAKKYGGIYQTRYEQMWTFILNHQLDKVNGGWFPTVDERNKPVTRNKSDAWTEGYHQGRAIYLATGARLYPKHK